MAVQTLFGVESSSKVILCFQEATMSLSLEELNSAFYSLWRIRSDFQCIVAEHMLFYASEKYPLEDSYSKFIIEVYFLLHDFQWLSFYVFFSFLWWNWNIIPNCFLQGFHLWDIEVALPCLNLLKCIVSFVKFVSDMIKFLAHPVRIISWWFSLRFLLVIM